MNLIRWQRPISHWPNLGRLTDLREELDRFFETPLSELTQSSQLLSGWAPPLDVHEDKDNIIVQAELPGMKKEDIEVSLQDGNLTISGERRTESKFEKAEICRAERFIGRFQRTIALPTPVGMDKVKATYTDGILTVTLPKAEEAKPKQINVQEG